MKSVRILLKLQDTLMLLHNCKKYNRQTWTLWNFKFHRNDYRQMFSTWVLVISWQLTLDAAHSFRDFYRRKLACLLFATVSKFVYFSVTFIFKSLFANYFHPAQVTMNRQMRFEKAETKISAIKRHFPREDSVSNFCNQSDFYRFLWISWNQMDFCQ